MKQTLYPKTIRVCLEKFQITEKLDGSNLGFFKYDGKLFIAQRNNIYSLEEIPTLSKDDLYGGLFGWLKEFGDKLEEVLYEGACIFGEWLGMHNKYNFENKYYMFAKANINFHINSTWSIDNLYYDRNLFIYPFKEQEIPDFISIVPLVAEVSEISIDELNKIYNHYKDIVVQRNVEGFIVIYNKDLIKKYVRMKSGKLEEHFW